MRVAALFDIHGNLPALEAVMAEARAAGVEAVVLGGDVALGPMPAEALACLRGLGLSLHCVRGNCDRGMLESLDGEIQDRMPEAAEASLRWAARQLDAEMLDWMRSWPLAINLDGVLFCHATPRDDNEIFVASTPAEAVAPAFAECSAPSVVCGHTHMPFDRAIGATRVINAGSVGMPFGASGADWLLVGAAVRQAGRGAKPRGAPHPSIEFRHTLYDFAAAAERVRRTQYPQAQEFADRDILHPRAAGEMERLFREHGVR